MKIKLYWPNCNYLNREWAKDGIDSYWVECTLEEAEEKVFGIIRIQGNGMHIVHSKKLRKSK